MILNTPRLLALNLAPISFYLTTTTTSVQTSRLFHLHFHHSSHFVLLRDRSAYHNHRSHSNSLFTVTTAVLVSTMVKVKRAGCLLTVYERLADIHYDYSLVDPNWKKWDPIEKHLKGEDPGGKIGYRVMLQWDYEKSLVIDEVYQDAADEDEEIDFETADRRAGERCQPFAQEYWFRLNYLHAVRKRKYDKMSQRQAEKDAIPDVVYEELGDIFEAVHDNAVIIREFHQYLTKQYSL